MKNIILLTYYGELFGQQCGDYSFMSEGLDQLCERLSDFDGIMEFVETMRELEKTGNDPMLNVVLDRLSKRGYLRKNKDGSYSYGSYNKYGNHNTFSGKLKRFD